MNDTIDQHVYHHYDTPIGGTFNIKIEKNSRSTNFEISILGARNAEEARELLKQAKSEIDRFLAENNLTD